jgi:hypothetical protein
MNNWRLKDLGAQPPLLYPDQQLPGQRKLQKRFAPFIPSLTRRRQVSDSGIRMPTALPFTLRKKMQRVRQPEFH